MKPQYVNLHTRAPITDYNGAFDAKFPNDRDRKILIFQLEINWFWAHAPWSKRLNRKNSIKFYDSTASLDALKVRMSNARITADSNGTDSLKVKNLLAMLNWASQFIHSLEFVRSLRCNDRVQFIGKTTTTAAIWINFQGYSVYYGVTAVCRDRTILTIYLYNCK